MESVIVSPHASWVTELIVSFSKNSFFSQVFTKSYFILAVNVYIFPYSFKTWKSLISCKVESRFSLAQQRAQKKWRTQIRSMWWRNISFSWKSYFCLNLLCWQRQHQLIVSQNFRKHDLVPPWWISNFVSLNFPKHCKKKTWLTDRSVETSVPNSLYADNRLFIQQ